MPVARKFGRIKSPPDPLGRELHLRRYLMPGQLPQLPEQCINSRSVGDDCGMLGNDRVGNCVIAGGMHLDQDWLSNAGHDFRFTTEQALQVYSEVTGYNPADPTTDNGTDPVQFLKFWRSRTLLGKSIGGFALLPTCDLETLKYTILLFGGCLAGFTLPDSCLDREDWNYTPSPAEHIYDMPNPANGHEVVIVDYMPDRFRVRTWGTTIDMSPAFYGAYCDQAFAVFSNDMLRGDGRSPRGFDAGALRADLARVGRMTP